MNEIPQFENLIKGILNTSLEKIEKIDVNSTQAQPYMEKKSHNIKEYYFPKGKVNVRSLNGEKFIHCNGVNEEAFFIYKKYENTETEDK